LVCLHEKKQRGYANAHAARKHASFERFGAASGALAPVPDDDDEDEVEFAPLHDNAPASSLPVDAAASLFTTGDVQETGDAASATMNGHQSAHSVFDAAFVNEAPVVAESAAVASGDGFEAHAPAAFDIDGSSLDAEPASKEREGAAVVASAAAMSDAAANKSPASSAGVKRAFEARVKGLAVRTDAHMQGEDDDDDAGFTAKHSAADAPFSVDDSMADHGSFVAAASLDVPSLAADSPIRPPAPVAAAPVAAAPVAAAPVAAASETTAPAVAVGDDDGFGDFAEPIAAPAAAVAAPAQETDDFGDFEAPAAVAMAAAPQAKDDFGDFDDAEFETATASTAVEQLTIPVALPTVPESTTPAVPLSQQWKDGTLFGPTRCKVCSVAARRRSPATQTALTSRGSRSQVCNAPARTAFCLACGDRQGAPSAIAPSTAKINETLRRVVEWDARCVDDPNSLPLVGLESDSALRLLLAEADVPPPPVKPKPPQLSPKPASSGSAFLIV